MTDPFAVEWTDDALEDWRRLVLSEAHSVALAVERLAATGEGFIVPGEDGLYLLFADSLVVETLVHRGTIYVVRLRHA
jgi:hypothetical protein